MALTKVPSSMLVLPLDTGEGTAVASSGTTNLDTATGNFVHITGTTTITAITLAQGATRWVVFDGVLTLTHSASLILPGAVNITTAAGDAALFVGEGSSVTRCLVYIRASGNPIKTSVAAFTNALVHVREEQTSGTAGGTFTSGARRTRVLNTVKTNEISGVALSSDTLTGVPAGTYYCEASAPAKGVEEHKAFLRNVTAGADLIIGTSERAYSMEEHVTSSRMTGRFTLAAISTIKIEHQGAVTKTTTGFGSATGFGTEVYSDLKIWKVS